MKTIHKKRATGGDGRRDARARGIWQGMNWIRQQKRLAIYLRDGLACAYCGTAVEDGASLTLDHLLCHSKGGTNHQTNLVTACERCNKSRGARSVEKFCKGMAGYRGIPAATILKHVRKTSMKDLGAYLTEAQKMMDRRGSAAAVIASLKKEK